MPIVAVSIGTAVVAFTSTNIDAFALLVVLFLRYRQSRAAVRLIVLAQYLVFAVLIGASLAAAGALATLPLAWVGLLGVIPLALGVRGLWLARRKGVDERPIEGGFHTIIVLTLSTCADNMSVYIVLFRAQPVGQTAVTIAVFAILEAVWCASAAFVTSRKRVVTLLEPAEKWIVPAMFVALGIAILLRTGVAAEIVRFLAT